MYHVSYVRKKTYNLKFSRCSG